MDYFNIRRIAVSILALGDVTSCYDSEAYCGNSDASHSCQYIYTMALSQRQDRHQIGNTPNNTPNKTILYSE